MRSFLVALGNLFLCVARENRELSGKGEGGWWRVTESESQNQGLKLIERGGAHSWRCRWCPLDGLMMKWQEELVLEFFRAQPGIGDSDDRCLTVWLRRLWL
jgi:hypothetical protein